MPVLSVDLAFRRWSDLGIVVLDRARNLEPARSSVHTFATVLGIPLKPMFSSPDGCAFHDGPIACEIMPSLEPYTESGPVDPNILAGILNHMCAVRGIRVMMLDGPQAWKSSHNGLEHARLSEQQLNTAAKTGLPGMVKPITYRPFAEFCLDVYDALCHRGWRRLDTHSKPGASTDRVLVESYPHAAWKSLGIKPLPAKKRATVFDLAEAYGALNALIPITTNRPPNHDQLQAIVGGLPGLALEERNAAGARIVGNPPRREDGHWREGFIVLPTPPLPQVNQRWLHSLRWLD